MAQAALPNLQRLPFSCSNVAAQPRLLHLCLRIESRSNVSAQHRLLHLYLRIKSPCSCVKVWSWQLHRQIKRVRS